MMLACPTLHACPSDIKAIAEGTGVDKAELCSRLVRAALSSVAPILSRELRSSPLSSLWRGCINGGRRGCSREILRCRVCATRIIRRAPAPNSSLPARPLVLCFGILVFRPKVGVSSSGSSRLIDACSDASVSDSGRRDALRCHLGLAVPAVGKGVLVARQLLLGQACHTTTDNLSVVIPLYSLAQHLPPREALPCSIGRSGILSRRLPTKSARAHAAPNYRPRSEQGGRTVGRQ